ncbi:MAG: hypothetical protein LBK65_00450 [Tannerellaceae bacterium]|nr:hypothetical protein [Tannerellaceae bacterium]
MNNCYSNTPTTTKGCREVCFISESYGRGYVSGRVSRVPDGLAFEGGALNSTTSTGGFRETCIILTVNPHEYVLRGLVYTLKHLGRAACNLTRAFRAFFLKPVTYTLKDENIVTRGDYAAPGKDGVIYKRRSIDEMDGDLFPKEDLRDIKVTPITRRVMNFRLDTQGFVHTTGDLSHMSGALRHISRRFAHMSGGFAHMSEALAHMSNGLAHMSKNPSHILKGMSRVSEGLGTACDSHLRVSGKIIRLYRTRKYIPGRPRHRRGGITFATIRIEKNKHY